MSLMDPSSPEFIAKADALRARYAAVEVPEQFQTVELESDAYFAASKSELLRAAADALQLGRVATKLLTIQRYMLLPDSDSHLLAFGQRHYMSEDYVTRLDLHGVQPLVSIGQTRTDYNYMVVQYTKHDLGENAVRRILHYAEDAES